MNLDKYFYSGILSTKVLLAYKFVGQNRQEASLFLSIYLRVTKTQEPFLSPPDSLCRLSSLWILAYLRSYAHECQPLQLQRTNQFKSRLTNNYLLVQCLAYQFRFAFSKQYSYTSEPS